MKAEYTKENRELVDHWLDNPSFQRIVEQDLGAPIKVVVWWAGGVVKFEGPQGAKVLAIAHILEGAKALKEYHTGVRH